MNASARVRVVVPSWNLSLHCPDSNSAAVVSVQRAVSWSRTDYVPTHGSSAAAFRLRCRAASGAGRRMDRVGGCRVDCQRGLRAYNHVLLVMLVDACGRGGRGLLCHVVYDGCSFLMKFAGIWHDDRITGSSYQSPPIHATTPEFVLFIIAYLRYMTPLCTFATV
jgi:hypothetical protein